MSKQIREEMEADFRDLLKKELDHRTNLAPSEDTERFLNFRYGKGRTKRKEGIEEGRGIYGTGGG